MSNVFTETYDAIADGVDVTAANSAYTSVTKQNGGTIVADTAVKHVGAASGKFSVTGATMNAYATVSFVSATLRYVRAYFMFDAIPSANVPILVAKLGTTLVGQVTLDGTGDSVPGSLKLQNSSGTLVGSRSAAITAGTWFRVELLIDTAATTLTARGYLGSNVDSTTIDWNPSTTTNGAFAGIDTMLIGVAAAGPTSLVLHVDDHKADNATWVGPAATIVNVTVSGAVARGTGTSPAGAASAVQYAYPRTDVAYPGWSRTPSAATTFSQTIDETSVDNTDYIESGINPQAQLGCTWLDPLVDPGIDAGWVLQVTAEFANGTTGSILVQLVQGPVNADGTGGTVVHAQTVTLSSAWATTDIAIPTASMATVTDTTQLYARTYASAA